MTTEIPIFIDTMRNAQLMHSRGDWLGAIDYWQQARGVAPDESEAARALRGESQSTFRLGESRGDLGLQSDGLTLAARAFDAHNSLLTLAKSEAPQEKDSLEARYREQIESGRVLGRMTLKQALQGERDTGKIQGIQLRAAQRRFDTIAVSLGSLRALQSSSRQSGQKLPDQHEINAAPDLAFGEMFSSDRSHGRASLLAHNARRLAWRSESPRLPTSANLGWPHRAKAVSKSLYRAYAATCANMLVTPQQTRRRAAAIRIATLPGVL